MRWKMTGVIQPKGGRQAQFRKRVQPHLWVKGPQFRTQFFFPGDGKAPEHNPFVTPGKEIKFSLATRDPELIKKRGILAEQQCEALIARMEDISAPLLEYQVKKYALNIRDFVTSIKLPSEDVHNSFEVLRIFYRINADCRYDKRQNSRDENLRNFVGILPFADSDTYADFMNKMEKFDFQEMSEIRGYKVHRDDDFSDEAIRFRTEAAARWWMKVCKISLSAHDINLVMRALDEILLSSNQDSYPEAPQKSHVGSKRHLKAKISIKEVFDKWENEQPHSYNTFRSWSPIICKLDDYLEGKSVDQISRDDIVKWKDDLLKRAHLRPENVAKNYLKAVTTMFNFAMRNEYIEFNPLQNPIMKLSKSRIPDISPYKDSDVTFILHSACCFDINHRFRWIPWLLASSGARVGEITQMQSSQIVHEDGIWAMVIRPSVDGGTVKTKGSNRVVPIHHRIIADGFLEFLKGRVGMPLFYKPRSGMLGKSHPSASVGSTHADWIKSLEGSKIDFTNKSPNHSFRHWFTAKQLELDVKESVTARIQGHKISGDRDTYVPDQMLRLMKIAIDKMGFDHI